MAQSMKIGNEERGAVPPSDVKVHVICQTLPGSGKSTILRQKGGYFDRPDVLIISKDETEIAFRNRNPTRQGGPRLKDYGPMMKEMLMGEERYSEIVLDMNVNADWVKFFYATVQSCNYRVTDVICMQPDANVSFSEKLIVASVNISHRTKEVPASERSTMPGGKKGYDILRKSEYWTSQGRCQFSPQRLQQSLLKADMAEDVPFTALPLEFPRFVGQLVECIEVDESWRDAEFCMEFVTLKGEPDGNVPNIHTLPEEMPPEWADMVEFPAQQRNNEILLLNETVTRLAKNVAKHAINAALGQDGA